MATSSRPMLCLESPAAAKRVTAATHGKRRGAYSWKSFSSREKGSRDMAISKEQERGTHTRRWGWLPLGGGTWREGETERERERDEIKTTSTCVLSRVAIKVILGSM